MQFEELPTDEEMCKWAGITYEGDEVPVQIRKLIWAARTQGKRIAWRDVYQISAQQHDSYSMADWPGGLVVRNSESAKD